MPKLNKVMLMGHLTREPETRYISGGNMAVCTIGLAVGGKHKDKNGQERDDTVFLDVTVFGKTAELCQRVLSKGSCLFVEGRLKMDVWEDRNGGGKRSKISVVGERVEFIPSSSGGNGSGNGGNRRPPQTQTAANRNAVQAPDSMPATEEPPYSDDIPF